MSCEQSKKEPHQTSTLDTSRDMSLVPTRQEVEAEKQAALNKGTACPSSLRSEAKSQRGPQRGSACLSWLSKKQAPLTALLSS